jgi:hypothetical protein
MARIKNISNEAITLTFAKGEGDLREEIVLPQGSIKVSAKEAEDERLSRLLKKKKFVMVYKEKE